MSDIEAKQPAPEFETPVKPYAAGAPKSVEARKREWEANANACLHPKSSPPKTDAETLSQMRKGKVVSKVKVDPSFLKESEWENNRASTPTKKKALASKSVSRVDTSFLKETEYKPNRELTPTRLELEQTGAIKGELEETPANHSIYSTGKSSRSFAEEDETLEQKIRREVREPVRVFGGDPDFLKPKTRPMKQTDSDGLKSLKEQKKVQSADPSFLKETEYEPRVVEVGSAKVRSEAGKWEKKHELPNDDSTNFNNASAGDGPNVNDLTRKWTKIVEEDVYETVKSSDKIPVPSGMNVKNLKEKWNKSVEDKKEKGRQSVQEMDENR